MQSLGKIKERGRKRLEGGAQLDAATNSWFWNLWQRPVACNLLLSGARFGMVAKKESAEESG